MTDTFALDLKKTRRSAGLTQEDCAHLLNVDQSKISNFEHGKQVPDLREFTMLSLIFGTRFEGFFATMALDVCRGLRKRLAAMPQGNKSAASRFNRANTLHSLADRLAAINVQYHGGPD